MSVLPDGDSKSFLPQDSVVGGTGQKDSNAEALPSPDETAMELRLERMRVNDALCARDAVVERFAEACVSVRQKNLTIERLQHEKDDVERQLEVLRLKSVRADAEANSPRLEDDKKMMVAEITRLAETFKKLQDQVRLQNKNDTGKNASIVSANVENHAKTKKHDWETSLNRLLLLTNDSGPFSLFRDVSNVTPNPNSPDLAFLDRTGSQDLPSIPAVDYGQLEAVAAIDANDPDYRVAPEPALRIEERHAILAALPLPSDVPADVLRPILIPPPFTLHEFLGTTPASLRAQLGNYRVFQQFTTAWCPEREEHGYFLTPLFKCTTNPRVNTAHRWTCVDLSAKLDKPTECFYNKDGKWYYAGVYKAFRLDDLSVQEWETLSGETTQAIIKETLAGRKNTSPQNGYETGQLYAAGALRVACVGLQCIGFNSVLYRTIFEHADKCAQTGKWRGTPALGSGSPTPWTSGSASSSPLMATVDSRAPFHSASGAALRTPQSGGSDGVEGASVGKV